MMMKQIVKLIKKQMENKVLKERLKIVHLAIVHFNFNLFVILHLL